MKQTVFFLILFLTSLQTFSQTEKKITVDSIGSDLRKFYGINNENNDENYSSDKDSVISLLESMWISKFRKKERKITVDALNYQIDKHFDKNKTVFNFLKLTVSLKNDNSENFDAYINYLNKIMHTPSITSTQVKQYINGIYYFISDKYLYKSKSSTWKFFNGNYKFNYNKPEKTFTVDFQNSVIGAISNDNDTMKIFDTNGKYILLKSKWKGNKGYITWEYFNYSPSIIKAELDKYETDFKNTDFTADSVKFTNKDILNYKILGKLQNKASKRAKDQGYYPVFKSYGSGFKIKSKQENILFKSGIEMKGPYLKFTGSDSIKAVAEYIKNGKVYLKAKSDEFSSADSILKSNRAEITLYIAKNDSVTHPNVSLTVKNNEFSFARNKKGTGNLPFYDSYQKVYIKTDNITWNIKDSLIRFYSKRGNDAEIRSVDFFTKEDFLKQRMYEQKNPLFLIKKYTKKINSRTFYAEDYAAFVKQSKAGVIQRLIGLWHEGFIDYNPDTRQVTVKQKLYDYIKYFFDKKDYDYINIISKGKEREQNIGLYDLINAVYNTNTNNLTVFGAKRVILNRRKKVGFEPEKEHFVIGKNRDMYFAGRLRVALADFYGKDFYFNYENYEIKINKANKLLYRVWKKDFEETSEKDKPVYLNSLVENVTGTVRIDIKTNKSGAKNIPKFPIFTCKDTSYVYYDKNNKQGNVYKRDNFYFKNYPFEHDSLLYLSKYNLKIPGRLIAGGIVPDFEDTLEVQNDYSLGLTHQTPEEGMDLFSGKVSLSAENSTLKSFIKLSNEGLVANGVAKWNNTTITTKDFNLYPDSLTAMADKIEISEYINENTYAEFPQVKGEMVSTIWNADKDEITYKTTEGNPVRMYDDRAKFEGVFKYNPKKIEGKGKFSLNEGIIQADDFVFSKKSLTSENANILIREKNSGSKDVIIKNMKSYIDVDAEKAVFAKNEDKESSVTFVTDKYVSYPTHLVWHTGKGKINMGYNMNRFTNPKFSKEKKLLDSAYLVDKCKFDKSMFMSEYGNMKFISTDAAKDSLMFFGSVANYYTGNHKIVVKDVQKIIVADIVVTPSSDVIIDQNGDMEKLLKTTVKARGLHNITDVDIQINSSQSYVASSGIYQYEDMNKKLQNINFDNITYDRQKQASVAHGFVEQYEKFTLNPWFDFYGDVYFNASKDRLRFEGYAKIKHSCNMPKPKWFYFKSEINPDSIYLPLENNLHSDLASSKARIFADIMRAKDSTHIFSTFMTTDPFGTSESILSVRDSSYYITYDKGSNKYIITTLEKFNDNMKPGGYLDLNRNYCIVNGEGKLNLTKSLRIKDLKSAGIARYDNNSGELLLQTLTYFDFFISKKALNILSEKLILNISLNSLKVNSNSYKKLLYEMIGEEKTNTMLGEMSENAGKPKKFPDEINKTFVFNDLTFEWDNASQSYKSKGKIGIQNIGDKMINKYVNGYIQIRKRRGGDKVYIYLETAENEWFFFTFSGGIMRTISSVHEYNQTIEDLKTKEKRFKTDKGIYNYMLTNEETKNNFIYEFTGEHPALNEFEQDENIDDE